MAYKFNPLSGALDITLSPSEIKDVAKNATSTKIIYTSQDEGSDTNDGSIFKAFKTIQAGINAANALAAYYNQIVVLVYPSSTGNGYNENLTLSQQGVVLQSAALRYRADTAVIKGSVTINLTGTSGGTNFVAASNAVYIRGLVIVANGSANTINFTGSTFQRLFLTDCYLDNTGTGSAINMTNTGVSGGTKSTITVRETDIQNNSATNPALRVSAGRIFIAGSNPDLSNTNSATAPALTIDGASATACSFSLTNGSVGGQVLVSDNLSTASFSVTSITSGSAAAIVTAASPNTGYIFLANVGLNTTATNSITGSGVVLLAGVARLSTGGDIIGTVTQSVIGGLPQGQLMLGATATQTANSILTFKNGHIKSQQTTAPTIAAANSGTGATVTVSNATDSAGKINYTAGTGVITNTATVTLTFNKAHATAPVVVLTPANSTAGVNVVQVYTTTTTSAMVLNFATAPVVSSTYNWFYHVLETQ